MLQAVVSHHMRTGNQFWALSRCSKYSSPSSLRSLQAPIYLFFLYSSILWGDGALSSHLCVDGRGQVERFHSLLPQLGLEVQLRSSGKCLYVLSHHSGHKGALNTVTVNWPLKEQRQVQVETASQTPTHYSCLLEFYSRSEIVLYRPKLKVRFHIGGHTEFIAIGFLFSCAVSWKLPWPWVVCNLTGSY